MNLNKWMRKYGNVLLMIFMAGLLVAFLLPPEFFNVRGRAAASARVGSAFGEPVTANDINSARQLSSLVTGVGLGMPRGLTDLHVHLLRQEARRAGISIGNDYVKEQLATLENIDEQLRRLNERLHMSYDDMYATIGEWVAINRLANVQTAALGTSLPRLKHQFATQRQDADVLTSVLLAEAFVDDVPEPTEEELQTFFEAARTRFTNHTEDGLSFGYRRPDRVKIEYLTVDPARIKETIRIREAEAREHFEQNPEQYTKEVPVAEDGGQPTATETVPMTFQEAEEQVKDDLREERAVAAAQRLVNELRQAAVAPWFATPRGEDGFNQRPPEGSLLSFEELANRPANPFPVQRGVTEFVSPEELRRQRPRLAQLSVVQGQGRVTLPDLAFRVPPLYQIPENPAPGQRFVLSIDEPSPVMLTRGGRGQPAGGQAYFFRVVDARPSAPPESLDDGEGLREQVIEDWKLVQAYQLAEEQARRLADLARENGLEQATATAEVLQQMLLLEDEQSDTTRRARNLFTPSEPPLFTRARQFLGGGIQPPPSLAEEIFAAEDLGAQPLSERIFVAGSPMSQVWLVAEVTQVNPVYEQQFEQQRLQLLQQSLGMELRFLQGQWFNPESIEARAGYRPAQPMAG
jgi:hypothetical protein